MASHDRRDLVDTAQRIALITFAAIIFLSFVCSFYCCAPSLGSRDEQIDPERQPLVHESASTNT